MDREASLADYSPWGCKESDMTEGLTLSLFLCFIFWIPHVSDNTQYLSI